MIYKKINLKDYYPMLEDDVSLTAYCPDNSPEINPNRKRKTILIFPGGGYEFCSYREAEPVALRFLGYDFNCFVIIYNTKPKTHMSPTIEGMAAIAFIREHADEYNVDINCVGTMGFSAGGHAAGTVAMRSENKTVADILNVAPSLLKINFFISCYAVITFEKDKTHYGTMHWLSNDDEKLIEAYSIEKHVTKDFPPTYIFATEDDTCVPAINSKLLDQACLDNNVKVQCHIFPHGWHGLSLADRSVYTEICTDKELESVKDVCGWVDEAIKFIREL